MNRPAPAPDSLPEEAKVQASRTLGSRRHPATDPAPGRYAFS
jgi:hypothetical protein